MTAELEKEIFALSISEKRQLIERLWQELEKTSDATDEIDPELLRELERRSDEYDKNPNGMRLEEFEKKLLGK